MKLIDKAEQVIDFEYGIFKHKKKLYSDTIYTYDIETTSLFEIDGRLKEFDYDRPKEYYRDKKKYALPYVSQFAVEDTVYYFRDFYLFADILKKISSLDVQKIIYVHNLSYEFYWLLNIIKKEKWTLTDYIVRKRQSVVCFTIKELNIQFRCSLCLTNLSLENSAKEYQCKNRKQKGKLAYNVARSPLSVLTKDNLIYCEFDLLVMHEFLSKFRDEYKHIERIPLTQTGEVRRYFVENYLDFYHIKKMQNLVPEPWEWILLMCAFMGGITHANFYRACQILKDVGSWDYSSDYPFQLCCEKYPIENFYEIEEWEIEHMQKSCCLLYELKLTGVKSKIFNHYIPFSKCENLEGGRFDNGRIVSAKSLRITVTDVDKEMIEASYDIDKIEIEHVYAAHKGYLPKNVILGILDLYSKKTTLKDIEEMEFSYMKSKQKINGTFGCSCTNILKQRHFINLDKFDIWDNEDMDLKFIQKKILEAKKSFSTLFQYSSGVWCTAYARKALWKIVLKTDKDVVYYDTDSVKLLNYIKYEHLINEINKEQEAKCRAVAKYYDIPFEMFEPKDKRGIKHLLGKLDFEKVYQQFITLGAKKYCYVDEIGTHITVSGVKKDAVALMKNGIYDFHDGYEFGYDAGKLALTYEPCQEPFEFEDNDGNIYKCDNIKYAVIMQPTTYKLSDSVNSENALENIEGGDYY